jgi:hypothetical protein
MIQTRFFTLFLSFSKCERECTVNKFFQSFRTACMHVSDHLMSVSDRFKTVFFEDDHETVKNARSGTVNDCNVGRLGTFGLESRNAMERKVENVHVHASKNERSTVLEC